MLKILKNFYTSKNFYFKRHRSLTLENTKGFHNNHFRKLALSVNFESLTVFYKYL